MKSFAYVVLLLVLPFGAARAQSAGAKNDLGRAGLAGSVKSVETWRVEYELKDGRSVEGRHVPLGRTTYDERGNKVEEVARDRDGSVLTRHVYTYDAEGRSTGYEEYSGILDKSLSKARRHVYRLDAEGRRVEYTVYESDGSVGSRFTYAYDAAGHKTEEAFYSWQGARFGKLAYAYDERGRLLTQTSYNADDSVDWKDVNVYDAEGRLAESARYVGETLRYRFFYKYDGRGRVKEVETREFNAVPGVYVTHAPEPGRAVYTYDDEKGTKEVATYREDGSLKSRLRYGADARAGGPGAVELNADGSVKPAEIRWFDQGVPLRAVSGVTSTEVTQDARGNWTRRTYLVRPAGADAPEPYGGEYREIVYY